MRNDAGVFSSARAMIGIGAASLILFAGFDARAHGGNPRADGIVFEPGNPKHIVIRSNNWGIFQTTDGGKSWNYGCAELFGGSWSAAAHRTVVVTT